MSLCVAPPAAGRAYPGHSARAARLLSVLDLAFRAAASVRLRSEPADQWSRNRNRATIAASMPATLRLL